MIFIPRSEISRLPKPLLTYFIEILQELQEIIYVKYLIQCLAESRC